MEREQNPDIIHDYCLFDCDEALHSQSRLLTQQSNHIFWSKAQSFDIGKGSCGIYALAVRRDPHFLNAYGNEARPGATGYHSESADQAQFLTSSLPRLPQSLTCPQQLHIHRICHLLQCLQ